MSRFQAALSTVLLLMAPSLSFAETPWGEKDESDALREAQTYHIMFAKESDAAKAKARLASKSGRDLFEAFKRTARAESRDPGSAAAGGDLGLVQEGVMVKSFEKALFALAPQTVSEPVKSEFGWHLIYAVSFSRTSVKQICTDSLAAAAGRAEGSEREALKASDSLVQAPDYVQRITSIIGDQWGRPLKDWNGDLAFVQIIPASDKAGPPKALVHVEYTKPVLSTSPLACRRSVRQEYEIDCDARLAAAAGRFEYEGRGATGRQLLQHRTSDADRRKYASGTGFQGQLVAEACPRRP